MLGWAKPVHLQVRLGPSLRRIVIGRRSSGSVRDASAGAEDDGGVPAARRSVPQNPLTRLQQIAIDLGRLAEALEHESDIDAHNLRHWSHELTKIRSEVEERYTAKPHELGQDGD
jgi:hypothetical protein